MSFLNKLFRRAPAPSAASPAAAAGHPDAPSRVTLIALLDRLPDTLAGVLQEFPTRLPALGALTAAGGETTLPAQLQAGGHSVWALGIDAPIPEASQRQSVFFSNWADELKAPLYAHRAHVLLCYMDGSDDPVVQLSVLYAVAAGLRPLGVADEAAFNCVPGPALADVCSAEFLLEAQRNIPSQIWTGLLKFHREDGQIWYTTRGFDRFGKANLAFLAPAGHGEQATDLFHTLLNYQHFYQQRFEPGHTAELGGQFLTFTEPHEYAEYLSGGLPVLTVRVGE